MRPMPEKASMDGLAHGLIHFGVNRHPVPCTENGARPLGQIQFPRKRMAAHAPHSRFPPNE